MEPTQIKFANLGGGGAFLDTNRPPDPLEEEIKDETPPIEEEEQDQPEVIIDDNVDDASDDLEEEVEETDEEDSEEEDKFNPHFFLARQLKEDGILPEEMEVDEDITYDKLVEAYRSRMENPLRQELESQVIQEALNKGWNEQDLFYARAYSQGVDPRMFQPAERMRQYGSVDVDKLDDKASMEVVKSMYQFKGTSDADAEILIQAREDSDTFDQLVKEAVDYHKQGYTEWKTQEDQRAAAYQAEQIAQRNAVQSKVKTILSERKVAEFSMTKEQAEDLYKDIYEANATVEVEGQLQRVPEINKFLHEFTNDVELQIKLYMLHKHQDRLLQSAKNTAKNELEEEMLRASGREVKKEETNQKKTAEQR
jgi:hypothetical protein